MLNFSPFIQPNLFTNRIGLVVLVIVCCCISSVETSASNAKFVINEGSPYYIRANEWSEAPKGGDTIFIRSGRTKAIKFVALEGDENNPITVINQGGQVQINDVDTWGALTFENCKYIKVTGTGSSAYKYGFLLTAKTCGLAFSGLSSNCEAEFVKISHDGFFGILAKKDYYGNPPSPIPVFSDLHIHDCFIENVTEGMYLGETKSPGMEFKHVRIYNNIVRNTGRESIQVANMVEDVEIYNNTLLNAGLDGDKYHENLLQIGDNTVAKVYNNILKSAPAYGIINMGSGNNYLENNYMASCKGIFIDDRKFTLQDSLITVIGNYFTNIVNPANEIIRNMNGENYLVVKNNKYDNEDYLFYRNYFDYYDNFTLENNQLVSIYPIQFKDEEFNNYALSENNPLVYAGLGAPGGPEYFGEDSEEEPVSEQIVLTSEMIVDEVAGGSYWTAGYLVDEQALNPENGLHPTSQSWKPFYNMSKGPYHIYIDLGQEYNLTNIALHDMHNVKNLDVSIGEPGNWEYLFTEPCNKYKKWKQHAVDVETRYIRLSMNESVYAAINEIVLYGYAIEQTDLVFDKSAVIQDNAVFAEKTNYDLWYGADVFSCQNPVQNTLSLNIPEEMNNDFSIEIFSLNGMRLFTKKYLQNYSKKLVINVSECCAKDEMYIVRYKNNMGITKNLKFLKQSF